MENKLYKITAVNKYPQKIKYRVTTLKKIHTHMGYFICNVLSEEKSCYRPGYIV